MEMHHYLSTSRSAPGPRVVLVWLILMGLAACQTSPAPQKPQAVTPAAAAAAAGAIPAGAREYKVSAAQSLLQILVYRGGAMAKLGHNHVIASHHLAGSVYVTDEAQATRFDISFPVSELTVDEPAQRAAAGADFPATVPQNARDGTRTNMLSPALLDAAQYPVVRLRATDIRATGDTYDAGVEITLKGATYAMRVPVTVTRAAGSLTASGEFPLWQSQLGLKPFSVAMGTLVVLDEMKVRFAITALGS